MVCDVVDYFGRFCNNKDPLELHGEGLQGIKALETISAAGSGIQGCVGPGRIRAATRTR